RRFSADRRRRNDLRELGIWRHCRTARQRAAGVWGGLMSGLRSTVSGLRSVALVLFSTTLIAQDGPFGGPPPNREAPAPNVSYERIRDASKEPQNWLTYSGGYQSQRHSLLTTIRPTNARDLELKWVFQSRSL